ncbi:putative adenine deaminase [Mycena sanguinolenta]|uniref:Putative adenine deaminase n=1 Tax=Mycena sanguinolenta TaxID=230812 RepID=A0A8H6ZAS6_9AGAR|nr:putative adenine deaminase [Mycena sanguinolenta]
MLTIKTIFIALIAANLGFCCPQSTYSIEDGLEIARINNARRATRNIPEPKKIAITNVRVFDGEKLLPLGTVFIDGDKIVAHAEGAEVVDGNGGTLLPGLIDAHTHPASVDDLEALATNGVTSTMVMMCRPPAVCESLLNHTGLTDVRFCGLGATSPNSSLAMQFSVSENQTISSPSQAPQFVAEQLAIGATFIKIAEDVLTSPTRLDQPTLNALVDAAHAKNVPVACHAADYAAFDAALASHADQIQHAPQDFPLDSPLIARFIAQKTVSVPTLLIFQEYIARGAAPASAYGVANTSVTRLYHAGVPILAGTDSTPVNAVPFGVGLHNELENLVGAGMSTVDVLRSATVLAAQHNLLWDRGVIAPGMRADVVLISGDPIANISATRNIQKVWITGMEYKGVTTSS